MTEDVNPEVKEQAPSGRAHPLVRPLCRVCGQQILSPPLHPCRVDHPERVREIRKLEAIREKTGGYPEMDRTISDLRDEIGWTNVKVSRKAGEKGDYHGK